MSLNKSPSFVAKSTTVQKVNPINLIKRGKLHDKWIIIFSIQVLFLLLFYSFFNRKLENALSRGVYDEEIMELHLGNEITIKDDENMNPYDTQNFSKVSKNCQKNSTKYNG